MVSVSAVIAGLAFALYTNLAAHLIHARLNARLALAGWGLGFPIVFAVLAYMTVLVSAGLDGGNAGPLFVRILVFFPAIVFGSAATAVVLRFPFGDRVAWVAVILAACAALLATSYPLLAESLFNEPLADDTYPVLDAMLIAWNATLCGALLVASIRRRRALHQGGVEDH